MSLIAREWWKYKFLSQRSSAAKNFVLEGPVSHVVSHWLTVETSYKAPEKSQKVCFGGGHGLFGLILPVPLSEQPAIEPINQSATKTGRMH